MRSRGEPRGQRATPSRFTTVGAVLLPLLTACATNPPPPPGPPPPAAAAVVLDQAAAEGLADLLWMEDRRALDLDRWRLLAAAASTPVRAAAALAAGRVAEQRARPVLLAALSDSAVRVRAAAVFALGRLGDSTSEVTAALARSLQANDSAALEAPLALARQNTRGAYAVLRQRLEGLQPAGHAPQQALAREGLLALWRFRERPGAAELAVRFTSAPDSSVRWAAAYALSRIGTPVSTGRLVELLTDAVPLVRATAIRGLRRGAIDSAGLAATALAGLRQLLSDPQPHVRINAARALAAFRDSADGAALAALLRDGDGNVRSAAAEALGSLPRNVAAGPLRDLAADAASQLALRGTALASLGRTDTVAALSLAGEWAASPEWLQRLYAVRALAALSWPAKAGLLVTFSRDRDPRIQGEAFAALAAADSLSPFAPIFLEGLASPDPIVRAGAAAGLGKRRDPAFYSALMQAYDRAQRDSLNDAALAAVDALSALAESGVPVAASFFLRFRPSADPVVRARVAQRFGAGEGSWGEVGTFEPPRNTAFYRQVVEEEIAPVLTGGAAPRVRVRTARGDVVLALDPVAAPLTVHNFLELIRSGFYARPELRWHRVVPNFVLQDGDPRGDGSGGPAHVIRDEINLLRYERGTVGMALSGPDTGGSQFFITHSPQPHLDGGYTVFGRVAAGMDVADLIVQDDRIIAIEVIR